MTSHEFTGLLAALRKLREQGLAEGAALATLLRTRGSTFRRAGARMLVRADGTVVRGLSAGCPDADIAAHAQQVIASGASRIVRYDREHGYDALLELGCGGELEVLVEPLRGASDLAFADAAGRCLALRRPGVMMSVFARDGVCLPQPRHLVWCDGVTFDDLADPPVADTLLSTIVPISAAAPVACVQTVNTPSGALDVFVERLTPPLRLVLVGAGLISAALAGLARTLGWDTVLVDHRDDLPRLPSLDGVERVCADARQLRERVGIDPRTAVVVVTHHLERDLDYLRALPPRTAGYVGAIGSRGRAEKMREALGALADGLHVPAGLDIGSETPEEIALAIAGEIQAEFNGHAGGRLSDGDGPIH